MAIIRDKMQKRDKTQVVADKIIARIYGMGRGKVITPKDFLYLGSHESIRQILSRLVKEGKIRRLLRGVYEYPEFSAALDANADPDPDAIARAHGWTIVPTGDAALNRWGPSTQIPAQWRYFSDGPTKAYRWSGGAIALTHRANAETSELSPATVLLVQALKALGKANADDAVLSQLRVTLSARDRARAAREGRYAASWVYEIIKRLAGDQECRHA
jgi:hypothetical protein